MLWTIVIIAGLVFLVYALWAYYAQTPAQGSVAGRIWAALTLAAAAIAAWATAFFHQGGVPS